MKFSHLVQINDSLNPLIDSLPREQLWRGLVMRAENPLLFVRFAYETLPGGAPAPTDEFYGSFARQAYVGADIDTISTIRRLAREQDSA